MSTPLPFQIGGLTVQPGTRGYTELPVTQLLSGETLSLPVHVVHGVQSGRALGLLAAIHGTEYPAIRVLKQIVTDVDPKQLRGTIVALPVVNPVSFARRERKNTPEFDVDQTNMNRVFPGARKEAAQYGDGMPHPSDFSLTEMMATVLVDEFFPKINALMDFHCTAKLGRAMLKVIVDRDLEGEMKEISYGMARAFNVGMIGPTSKNPKTATGYAAKLGIPSCVPEIGGSEQSRTMEDWMTDICVKGTLNVMRFLQMLPGEVVPPPRQVQCSFIPHVRATKGGFLLSEYDPPVLITPDTLGVPVKAGTLLGTIFDPYTFQTLEELRSPVDGRLYYTRRSGLTEPGDTAFAITDDKMTRDF